MEANYNRHEKPHRHTAQGRMLARGGEGRRGEHIQPERRARPGAPAQMRAGEAARSEDSRQGDGQSRCRHRGERRREGALHRRDVKKSGGTA